MKIVLSFFLLGFLFTALFAEEDFLLLHAFTNEVLLEKGSCLSQRLSPHSTFKIALSLMGYDAHILQDEENPKWPYQEGDIAWIDSWKAAQTPFSWMRNSCVWYSQLLFDQLGMTKVQHYLELFGYGNKDLSENVRPWFSSLKISPREQALFLQKLVLRKLPISEEAIQRTRVLLFLEELNGGGKLFGKTGSGREGNLESGWLIGWVEKEEDIFVFVYNVQEKKVGFSQRISRVKKMLSYAQVLKEEKE